MNKIVIGLDVSKKKIDATAIVTSCGGNGMEKLGYSVFENTACGFRKLLSWCSVIGRGCSAEDCLFCCETTGSYDRAMCLYLCAHRCFIWRESAIQIKRSSGVRKGKDDRSDSLMIAEYAVRHMDKAECFRPLDGTVEELRQLFLYRQRLVEERKGAAVSVSESFVGIKDGPVANCIKREMQRHLRHLDAMIRRCEILIRQTLMKDREVWDNFCRITTIKGVGLVNAVAFIVYTNNFQNFKTARQLASYYGVAAFRNRSGTSVDRRAQVSNLSNHRLKAYLAQAAECAARTNGIYRRYYERMVERGKHRMIILNNIRNKIIHTVFALVRDKCDFCIAK